MTIFEMAIQEEIRGGSGRGEGQDEYLLESGAKRSLGREGTGRGSRGYLEQGRGWQAGDIALVRDLVWEHDRQDEETFHEPLGGEALNPTILWKGLGMEDRKVIKEGSKV